MKTVLLLPLLFFISNNTTAQLLTRNQAEYFILGTLNDSDGRYINANYPSEFDYYFQWEKPLVLIIDSMVKVNYPKISFQLKQNKQQDVFSSYCAIYSDSLCHKFNRYYQFKPTGSTTFPESKTEYYGVLNDSIFRSDDEKLAFLAGVYVRFGTITDTAYSISIPNSASKIKTCYDLLIEFKCKSTYEIRRNYIPIGHILYFHPTEKIKAYLQKFQFLNKGIRDGWNQIIQSIVDNRGKMDTLKKNR